MTDKNDDVLVVTEDVDVGALGEHVFNDGPLPAEAHYETFEEICARGRVADCNCGLISCVCEIARQHEPECRFRKALTCAVGIDCDEHGREVCPICDACDCGAKNPADTSE